MLYSDKVLEHFANPHNAEKSPTRTAWRGRNAKCGDIMKMYLKIKDGVIEDAKFKTFGCGAAIATSSMATDMIKGSTIEDALKLSNQAVVEALDGLPASKIHCSVLAEQAVKAALADYYRKNGVDPDPIVGTITECEACHGL